MITTAVMNGQSDQASQAIIIATQRDSQDMIDRCVIDAEHFRLGSHAEALRGRATIQQPEAWITSDRGIVLPGGTGRAVAIVRLDGSVPLADELSCAGVSRKVLFIAKQI